MQALVNNGGVIIFGPFLPKFFERLNLTENGSFVNFEAQHRAVYLLQYLVYNAIDFSESDLLLNKLLVGMSLEVNLDPIGELTEEEKAMCENLMEGVKANWEKMQNSTDEAIRTTFLQRAALLETETGNPLLSVESRGVDILLRTIPWNISVVHLPWMNQPLNVEW